MSKSSYLNIEDALFGSILGAYLGTFIGNLKIYHIIILVFYFVLFPIILKIAENKSKYFFSAIGLSGISLLSIFMYYLTQNNFISSNVSISYVVVFMGWFISICYSAYIKEKRIKIIEKSNVEMESIPLTDVKALILLVSDYQKKNK